MFWLSVCVELGEEMFVFVSAFWDKSRICSFGVYIVMGGGLSQHMYVCMHEQQNIRKYTNIQLHTNLDTHTHTHFSNKNVYLC